MLTMFSSLTSCKSNILDFLQRSLMFIFSTSKWTLFSLSCRLILLIEREESSLFLYDTWLLHEPPPVLQEWKLISEIIESLHFLLWLFETVGFSSFEGYLQNAQVPILFSIPFMVILLLLSSYYAFFMSWICFDYLLINYLYFHSLYS